MTSWCILHLFSPLVHFFWCFFWKCAPFLICFYDFSEKVLPAYVGSTTLGVDTKQFTSKISFFRPQNGSDKAYFGEDFQPWAPPFNRDLASFRSLHGLAWWKNATKVCIIATGGLLGRLWKCIRHNFDDILMYPTPFWRYFDASNMILKAFSIFSPLFFMIFPKMCSLPT